MRLLITLAVLAGLSTPGWADEFEFGTPERITAAGAPIAVESPGYAAPCLHDMDGDGVKDLLVGQFNKGKISYFKGTKAGATDFAAHQWLQAAGKIAEVPGVW